MKRERWVRLLQPNDAFGCQRVKPLRAANEELGHAIFNCALNRSIEQIDEGEHLLGLLVSICGQRIRAVTGKTTTADAIKQVLHPSSVRR